MNKQDNKVYNIGQEEKSSNNTKLPQTFEEFYSLDQLEAIRIYEELIDKIGASKSGIWTVDSLKNYLNVVFLVNFNHNKSNFCNGESDIYAIFNTGLLMPNDLVNNYVYCVGKDSGADNGLYKFIGFFNKEECLKECINNVSLEDRFNKLLPAKDIFLIDYKKDIKLSLPEDDTMINEKNFGDIKKKVDKNFKSVGQGWTHIIIDGCDNLPYSLFKYLIDEDPNKKNDRNELRRLLFVTKRKSHEEGYEIILSRCKLIKDLIVKAFEQSKNNNEMVAPFYNPRVGKVNKTGINYALPLYIGHDTKPDCVLVFDNNGEAKTLLKMYEIRQNLNILGLRDLVQRIPWLRE